MDHYLTGKLISHYRRELTLSQTYDYLGRCYDTLELPECINPEWLASSKQQAIRD